jgi:hypothetical protein
MMPGRALQLVEALLKRHQSFYPNAELRSMKSALRDLITGVEEGIQVWIDSP